MFTNDFLIFMFQVRAFLYSVSILIIQLAVEPGNETRGSSHSDKTHSFFNKIILNNDEKHLEIKAPKILMILFYNHSFFIKSLPFSAIIIVGAFVFPLTSTGIMDASITRSLFIP